MNLTPRRARWIAAAALAIPILGMSLRYVGGSTVVYGQDFESYYGPHAAFAREAFTTGMRYSMLVGTALLGAGALFVWLRGASRPEAIEEDELDAVNASAAA